jgi:hypothetical protein
MTTLCQPDANICTHSFVKSSSRVFFSAFQRWHPELLRGLPKTLDVCVAGAGGGGGGWCVDPHDFLDPNLALSTVRQVPLSGCWHSMGCFNHLISNTGHHPLLDHSAHRLKRQLLLGEGAKDAQNGAAILPTDYIKGTLWRWSRAICDGLFGAFQRGLLLKELQAT